jgi:hypothetical protein
VELPDQALSDGYRRLRNAGGTTLRRLLLVILVGASLAGAAVFSKEVEPASARMSAAAETWISSLDDKQKAKALLAFDDRERTNWHYVPYQANKTPLRKGLRLEDMSAEQKAAALRLVEAGTSPSGFTKVTTIMSLESILREVEKNGVNVRNPGWYFFTVFGTPSKTGKWGWRVEGHHLSLNFTFDHGRVVGATPFFFGANPATVKDGPRKGLRTLPDAEDAARRLIDALDAEQRSAAQQAKLFADVEEAKPSSRTVDPVGLPASRMTDKQRALLSGLLADYAARMPEEVGNAELTRLKEAGIERIHFAFARELEKPGQPYTYRVQGPTFVVEFLNVQSDSANNPANHIHSVWRDLPSDFGLAAR